MENYLSYKFPFEGDKHLATIIELPFRKDTWRENAIPALEEYFNVIKAISKFEKVIVVYSKHVNKEYVEKISNLINVDIILEEYDDAWARDNSPIFMIDNKGDLLGLDFGFNAWGGSYNGLYKDYENDNSFSKRILEQLDIKRVAYKDFILEGGSIHVNSKGELLTTSCCLLSKGRNPLLNQKEITDKLKESLNVNKVTYLPYGIVNDETSGHIDNIACFLDDETVLLAYTDNSDDQQYDKSKEDEKVLLENGYKVIRMVLPKPMYLTKQEEQGIINNDTAIKRIEGRRLAASYVNFYMGDKFIILPKFGVKEDDIAKKILEDFYKGEKEIIQVYSKEILLGGGNIHCITKQIPYSSKYERK